MKRSIVECILDICALYKQWSYLFCLGIGIAEVLIYTFDFNSSFTLDIFHDDFFANAILGC